VNVESLLESAEPSLLVIEERSRKDIVVGVPHHAPAGTSTLPCPEHQVSDENAGFLGHYLAEKLDCCSIIACNYTIDVNKSLQSDYAVQIASWKPAVLVEIHGHGKEKARHDIEISSGSGVNSDCSETLAERLESVLSTSDGFKTISICGERDRLYYKASKAVTVSDERWVTYHIELPPELRKQPGDSMDVPRAGYEFCDALAKVLTEMYRS